MRVLIAEDEMSTAKAIKLLLEKANFSADIVYNGNDAWDYIATIDKEEAVRLAAQVYSKNKEHGFLEEYRYSRKDMAGATIIIFLNISRDRQFIRTLRNLTVIVVLISMVLVFVLVFLLSGRAILPMVHSIEQQKQFITDASHELKTPLTSISASIDVISLEHGEDEWTENIRNQTNRMSRLVGKLVALSRLDEEIPLPLKEKFSLTDAVWEIIEVYRPQITAQKKSLYLNIQNDIFLNGGKTRFNKCFLF